MKIDGRLILELRFLPGKWLCPWSASTLTESAGWAAGSSRISKFLIRKQVTLATESQQSLILLRWNCSLITLKTFSYYQHQISAVFRHKVIFCMFFIPSTHFQWKKVAVHCICKKSLRVWCSLPLRCVAKYLVICNKLFLRNYNKIFFTQNLHRQNVVFHDNLRQDNLVFKTEIFKKIGNGFCWNLVRLCDFLYHALLWTNLFQ